MVLRVSLNPLIADSYLLGMDFERLQQFRNLARRDRLSVPELGPGPILHLAEMSLNGLARKVAALLAMEEGAQIFQQEDRVLLVVLDAREPNGGLTRK